MNETYPASCRFGTIPTAAVLARLGIARRAAVIHNGLSAAERVMLTRAEIEHGLRLAAPEVFFLNLAAAASSEGRGGYATRATAARLVAEVAATIPAA